jgi:hypothetical protein
MLSIHKMCMRKQTKWTLMIRLKQWFLNLFKPVVNASLKTRWTTYRNKKLQLSHHQQGSKWLHTRTQRIYHK